MEYTSVSHLQRISRVTTLVFGSIALAVIGTVVATYRVFNSAPVETGLAQLNTSNDAASLVDAYQIWKNKHGLQFDPQEDAKRFTQYSHADKLINNHNSKNHSWKTAHNEFSHLSSAEFMAIYTGAQLYRMNDSNGSHHSSKKDPRNRSHLYNKTTPRVLDDALTSVDWVAVGAVTSVKFQGACGSCYTFSTTGALEGLAYLTSGQLPSLSEQQLVDCSRSWGNDGCGGGWAGNAFQYVIDNHGIISEDDYPYHSMYGTAGVCDTSNKQIAYNGITGYNYVTKNSASALVAAIANGPVSVGLDAKALQFYSSGIIDASADCSTNIDHAVLAVGFDTNAGYYIVKNSWNTWWGEQGYFRIAITGEDSGICGFQRWSLYPY